MKILVSLIISLMLILSVNGATTMSPTIRPSSNIQVGTFVLTNMTGKNSTTVTSISNINITYTFTKSFTTAPQVGVALCQFQANSALTYIYFNAYNSGSSTTAAKFVVSYMASTQVFKVVIKYIGVNSSLPYHFNVLSNQQIYSGTNVSTTSTITQNFNYTSATKNLLYTTLTNPKNYYIVIVYLTCLNFTASMSQTSTTKYPPQVNLTNYNIIDKNTISFTFILGTYCKIGLLHYTIIVYDKIQLLNSGLYNLTYARVNWTFSKNNSLPLAAAYQNYSIMGFSAFSSNSTNTYIIFNLYTGTVPSNGSYPNQGSFGIYMPASVSRVSSSQVSASLYSFSLFYMEDIICNVSTYYYDVNNSTCVNCSSVINNCTYCKNSTICTLCEDGYEINSASKCQKQKCTLPNCNVCNNDTGIPFCQLCNFSASYFKNDTAQCQLCDMNNNYFINLSSSEKQCIPCTINQCQQCKSLTQCSKCNIDNNYVIDKSTGQCILCPLFDCLKCTINITCSLCNTTDQYFLNDETGLCQPCPLDSCVNCYIDNYDNNKLKCQQCDDLTGFLNVDYCEPCAIQGCVICSSLITCQQCDGIIWFLNMSSMTCSECTIPYCTFCTSLQNCEICDNIMGFLNQTDNLCWQCSLPGCITCQTLETCFICDDIDLFLNETTELCQPCTLDSCTNCSTLYTCRECDNDTGFMNYTLELCFPCQLYKCEKCLTLIACQSCENITYFMNYTTQLCQLCSLEGCLTCSSLTICTQCDADNNYGLTHISNLTLCGSCNVSCTCDGYVQPWNTIADHCSSLCGDGYVRFTQQCDDGNIINGDGCSSSCTVQKYFVCDDRQPSICTLVVQIDDKYVTVEKDGCNQFVIKIQITFPQYSLAQMKADTSILNQGVSITSVTKQGSIILVHGTYSRNLINQPIKLHFSSGQVLPVSYTPGVPTLHYSDSMCKKQSSVEHLAVAYEVLSYILLFLSLISCKIVGLQLFGVLQLAYFTLSSHSYLNIYLAPLTGFRIFNGLNIKLTNEEVVLPEILTQMGIHTNFINNCNIMLVLLLGQLVIAGVMYFVGRFIYSRKILDISRILLKQGFITLVLFTSFNIAFSAGIHIKYANSQDKYYLFSVVLLLVAICFAFISALMMQFTSEGYYGEFKNKFKNDWACKFFIPLTIIYRIILGFYCAIKCDEDYTSVLVLGFSLAFLIYMVVNLPFNDTFQNYRSFLIQFTTTYILFTTDYYQTMKINTPIEIKAVIFSPAVIELVLLGICIVCSGLALGYEIYLTLKVYFEKKAKKIKDNQDNHICRTTNTTEDSFYLA